MHLFTEVYAPGSWYFSHSYGVQILQVASDFLLQGAFIYLFFDWEIPWKGN